MRPGRVDFNRAARASPQKENRICACTVRDTRRTITSHTRLARACARIRADGFATDDGEDVEELRCVAAPIRDRDAAIVASVGISAPLTRFPVSRYPIAAKEATEAARRISAALER